MFEWDEYNSAHIEGHDLSTDDVEDALLDPGRSTQAVSAHPLVMC